MRGRSHRTKAVSLAGILAAASLVQATPASAQVTAISCIHHSDGSYSVTASDRETGLAPGTNTVDEIWSMANNRVSSHQYQTDVPANGTAVFSDTVKTDAASGTITFIVTGLDFKAHRSQANWSNCADGGAAPKPSATATGTSSAAPIFASGTNGLNGSPTASAFTASPTSTTTTTATTTATTSTSSTDTATPSGSATPGATPSGSVSGALVTPTASGADPSLMREPTLMKFKKERKINWTLVEFAVPIAALVVMLVVALVRRRLRGRTG